MRRHGISTRKIEGLDRKGTSLSMGKLITWQINGTEAAVAAGANTARAWRKAEKELEKELEIRRKYELHFAKNLLLHCLNLDCLHWIRFHPHYLSRKSAWKMSTHLSILFLLIQRVLMMSQSSLPRIYSQQVSLFNLRHHLVNPVARESQLAN